MQPVLIELATPQTVDGRAATYQSLWLLVRLLHAHRLGQPLRLDEEDPIAVWRARATAAIASSARSSPAGSW